MVFKISRPRAFCVGCRLRRAQTRQTPPMTEGVNRRVRARQPLPTPSIRPIELRLLVYRAGPMARLGHNHVILNRAVGGWVDAAARLESASFSLYVPARFHRGRCAAGPRRPGFLRRLPEEAKSGTDAICWGGPADAERFRSSRSTSVGITRPRRATSRPP